MLRRKPTGEAIARESTGAAVVSWVRPHAQPKSFHARWVSVHRAATRGQQLRGLLGQLSLQ